MEALEKSTPAPASYGVSRIFTQNLFQSVIAVIVVGNSCRLCQTANGIKTVSIHVYLVALHVPSHSVPSLSSSASRLKPSENTLLDVEF